MLTITNANDLKLNSGACLPATVGDEELGVRALVGYWHTLNEASSDVVRRIDARLRHVGLLGWSAGYSHWSDTIPLGAVRVGQNKVRVGDPSSALYVQNHERPSTQPEPPVAFGIVRMVEPTLAEAHADMPGDHTPDSLRTVIGLCRDAWEEHEAPRYWFRMRCAELLLAELNGERAVTPEDYAAVALSAIVAAIAERTMIFCPFCGQRDTFMVEGSHFAESGDWVGEAYEREGTVDEYRCDACRGLWAAALPMD